MTTVIKTNAYGHPLVCDDKWHMQGGEKFWIVLKAGERTVLGEFRSLDSAVRFANTKAIMHRFNEYIVLEAISTIKQASHPVPEVNVIGFGETK